MLATTEQLTTTYNRWKDFIFVDPEHSLHAYVLFGVIFIARGASNRTLCNSMQDKNRSKKGKKAKWDPRWRTDGIELDLYAW